MRSEWVYTGDGKGSRYFIPLHGLDRTPRQNLVDEAMAARSERMMEQIAAENDEIRSSNIKNMTLHDPPTYAGLLLVAMEGGDQGEFDIHRFQKGWTDSKQPH